jgi:hypothetical protein
MKPRLEKDEGGSAFESRRTTPAISSAVGKMMQPPMVTAIADQHDDFRRNNLLATLAARLYHGSIGIGFLVAAAVSC